jgi:nucleotide-binding universal stress UspA family protein
MSPATAGTILVPYDGSTHARHALEFAISLALQTRDEVHVLNVQTPLSGDVSSFVGNAGVKQYHHDEGDKVLAPAKRLLEKPGVVFHTHIGVGQPGPVVCEFISQLRCTQVVMGSRGLNSALGLLLGSVATQIVGHAKVPVTLLK